MEIIIKTITGQVWKLEVDSNDTIERVKERIEKEQNIAPDTQRLIFESQQLLDNITVNQAGITEGCEVTLVLRLGGGWSVNENIKNKWSEYIEMLNNINWNRSNIPKSFDKIENDGANIMGHLLNAIDEYTNNNPSNIKNRTEFIDALNDIKDYTYPPKGGISDGSTPFYDYYKDYIRENIGYDAQQKKGANNNDNQQVLLPQQQQNKCGCAIL